MALKFGEPLWTDGHFQRASARDDLGIEELGAAQLRRLIPGVAETSVSAGYYSFYPFLVSEFQRQDPDELRRSEFQRFYRRQEVALTVGCSQHHHRDSDRGNLRGLNGIDRCGEAARHAGPGGLVDLAELAAPQRYMRTGLGGYGLFYRNVLEGIGLIRLGAGNSTVDRVTEMGERAAEAVRKVIVDTEYWHQFREADKVPMAVLSDLADALCPCDLPGRADHVPLLDAFFRDQGQSERWSQARRYRAMSLGLMLEFHQQRPDACGSPSAWRMALSSGWIGEQQWATAFTEHRDAWRAYQTRETMVASLSTIWSGFLLLLEEFEPAYRFEIRERLVGDMPWETLQISPRAPFSNVVDVARDRFASSPQQTVVAVESAMSAVGNGDMVGAMAEAVLLVGALAIEQPGSDVFAQLLTDGGDERLSYDHMHRWVFERVDRESGEVMSELVDKLVFRHLQVATSKLSPSDHRDPFCIDEGEDGRYRVVRGDEPFWTGARWSTLNHLLWTLGAIDSPDGDGRPTDLGHQLLREVTASV